MKLIDKDKVAAEIERRIKGLKECHADTVPGYAGEISGLERLLSFIDTLDVQEFPKWKKTMHDNGCWSCEIGVNPSKRLYEYEHYTINADELFKLLDKEE